MSQYPPSAYTVPRSPSNGLAIAGFIVSLVGLISCGLISPVGLIMSAFAMRREPRGLAIAGLVLGIVGSLWIIIALVFGLFAGILALVAGGLALGMAQSAIEINQIHQAVDTYYAQHAALPDQLDLLHLGQDVLTDKWGHPYRYKIDSLDSYTLSSDGADGTPGTNDDFSEQFTAPPLPTKASSPGSSPGSP
jgi:hypothetical protein